MLLPLIFAAFLFAVCIAFAAYVMRIVTDAFQYETEQDDSNTEPDELLENPLNIRRIYTDIAEQLINGDIDACEVRVHDIGSFVFDFTLVTGIKPTVENSNESDTYLISLPNAKK